MYTAQDKLKIIQYYDKYGLEAVQESLSFQTNPKTDKPYSVSLRTIFNWKKKYTESYENLYELSDKSRRPWVYRQSRVPTQIIGFIQQLRKDHHGIGKDKIKVFVDQYCIKHRIDPISTSSIGRVISRLKKSNSIPITKPSQKVYLDARAGKLRVRIIKKQTKKRRKDYIPQTPGDLVQIDTVEIRIDGMRRFIISAIDLTSRFAFSLGYKQLNSRNAKDFMSKLQKVSPYTIKHIQSDNGLEFHGEFQDNLENQKITQFFNYPRSPKMNAYIERYNRTIQEEFAYHNLNNMGYNMEEFNKDLIDYLMYYNFNRPHIGIDMKSPIQYLQSINQRKCNMLWTGTIS
ncbi:MAG: integrase core domain-containing protein [Patescibacteria group bacterium]